MAVCSACTTAINASAFFPGITGDELDDRAVTLGAAIKLHDSHTCADDSNCVCICTEFTVTGALSSNPSAEVALND